MTYLNVGQTFTYPEDHLRLLLYHIIYYCLCCFYIFIFTPTSRVGQKAEISENIIGIHIYIIYHYTLYTQIFGPIVIATLHCFALLRQRVYIMHYYFTFYNINCGEIIRMYYTGCVSMQVVFYCFPSGPYTQCSLKNKYD